MEEKINKKNGGQIVYCKCGQEAAALLIQGGLFRAAANGINDLIVTSLVG